MYNYKRGSSVPISVQTLLCVTPVSSACFTSIDARCLLTFLCVMNIAVHRVLVEPRSYDDTTDIMTVLWWLRVHIAYETYMCSSVHSVHNNVWVKFACLCRVLTNAKTKCHFRLHQADRLITSRRALVRSHRQYIHFMYLHAYMSTPKAKSRYLKDGFTRDGCRIIGLLRRELQRYIRFLWVNVHVHVHTCTCIYNRCHIMVNKLLWTTYCSDVILMMT